MQLKKSSKNIFKISLESQFRLHINPWVEIVWVKIGWANKWRVNNLSKLQQVDRIERVEFNFVTSNVMIDYLSIVDGFITLRGRDKLFWNNLFYYMG